MKCFQRQDKKLKLSKAQSSRIIQSNGLLGKNVCSVNHNLGKKSTNRPCRSFGSKRFP